MKNQKIQNKQMMATILFGLVAFALAIDCVAGVITVQIGGATRLNSLSRQRDRYNCYWDCDLVGCQIARDDDECAYDCEKVCRVRYDYAGRSGAAGSATGSADQLKNKNTVSDDQLSPKSAASESVASGSAENNAEIANELQGAGQSVRLHLPRNASARNFAIWERCSPDANTGKLTEQPFSL